MQLVNGNALVARLLRSGKDAGVKWLASSPLQRLVMDGSRVTGAILKTADGEQEIRARHAVMLATSGFPQNKERRAETFPKTGRRSALERRHTRGRRCRIAIGAKRRRSF
jgi:aspartate oxidase